MGRPAHLRGSPPEVATQPDSSDEPAANSRARRISRSYDRLRRIRTGLPPAQPDQPEHESPARLLEAEVQSATISAMPNPEPEPEMHLGSRLTLEPRRSDTDIPANSAHVFLHDSDAARSQLTTAVGTSPRSIPDGLAAVTLGQVCSCCCGGVRRLLSPVGLFFSFAKRLFWLHWAVPVTACAIAWITVDSWDQLTYQIMRHIRIPLLLVPFAFLGLLMLGDRLSSCLPECVARWMQSIVRYAFKLQFSDATVAAIAPITTRTLGYERTTSLAREYVTIYGLLTLISGVLCLWHMYLWLFASEEQPVQCSSSDPSTFNGHTSSKASSEELRELLRAFGLDEHGSKTELAERLHASTSPVDLLQCAVKREQWKLATRALRWRQERNSWISGLTFQLYVVTTYIRQLQEELRCREDTTWYKSGPKSMNSACSK